MGKETTNRAGRQIDDYLIASILLFYALAFVNDSPMQIVRGFWQILISRSVLITDYFAVGGMGAAFFNGALIMTITFVIVKLLRMQSGGLTIAIVYIMGGFALFGKNPVNILPILVGTILYAKIFGRKVKDVIYTGFLATTLAPLVTEIALILPYPLWVNLCLAFAGGLLIGFTAPLVYTYVSTLNRGYNIFNMGFAAGVLAVAAVSVLRSVGHVIETTLIWTEGYPLWLFFAFLGWSALTFLYGLVLSKGRIGNLRKIWKHTGRLPSDFVSMEGTGTVFMNMGMMGALCLGYLYLMKGDLSGPVLGALMTVVGFAAYGIHMKNYLPILIGIFLATEVKLFTPQTPAMQLAALFSAGLAPIAGEFGLLAGILAGFLHSSVAMSIGIIHGGMNLYSNGFAAGFIVIVLVPVLEAFRNLKKKKT
ncbi:DUF1576 domain-containing protein [Anaerolentibacter hominis]|uniref:DUF1576 domain-containing protein n=1 Tax=Anaerolentibacter hominis TaxID=3079009 RepID=UPI0031B854B0